MAGAHPCELTPERSFERGPGSPVDETVGSVVLAVSPGADSYGVADEVARRVLAFGGQVLAVRAADMPDSGKPAVTTVAAIESVLIG